MHWQLKQLETVEGSAAQFGSSTLHDLGLAGLEKGVGALQLWRRVH